MVELIKDDPEFQIVAVIWVCLVCYEVWNIGSRFV